MNKRLLIGLLTLFASTIGYSQNWNLNTQKSCWGDYPTYYANSKIYIYQNISTNRETNDSAIEGEVPAGSAVKVTNSFFGGTGWWEICYQGTTGWAKKSLLSYKKTSSTSNSNSSTNTSYQGSNQDVGFDPFIGQVTSNVNFRTGPSQSNTRIKTLNTGTQVYVYSNKTINGYYKAIDIMTSQIGWVHKNYIRYIQNADVNESGAFQSTGYASSYNSEVKIRNKSSYTIKLVVADETFTLSPNSTKTVNIKPGRKYYIATAPGVIPASGYQGFESNNGYEWEFWVSTTR